MDLRRARLAALIAEAAAAADVDATAAISSGMGCGCVILSQVQDALVSRVQPQVSGGRAV